MSLPLFVAFMTGMILEVILLYDRSRQGLIAGIFTGGVALTALLEIFGGGAVMVSLDDVIIGLLFTGIGLFVLFFGMVSPVLLPRINEQAALSTHLMVGLGLLLGQDSTVDVWLVGALMIPSTLGLLWAALRRDTLHPVPKALLYLWYLTLLIILTQQGGTFEFFSRSDLTLPDAFLFGGSFIFLLLHALFFVRFFLIVSTLILPRNRHFIKAVMPRHFSDEQIPPARMALFILGALALVALNGLLDIVYNPALISVLVMVGTQFIFGEGRDDISHKLF